MATDIASAREDVKVSTGASGSVPVFVGGSPRILTTHPKGFDPLWAARTVLLPDWLDAAARTQGRPLSFWESLYWGWKLLRASRKCDVVVTGFERSWQAFAIFQRLLGRKRKPHVFIYFFCGRLDRPLGVLKRWYYRLVASGCARIVVYSHRQIDLYAAALDLPREKFVCVPYHMTLDGYFGPVRGDLLSVREGDYIFSGGDFKDYVTLLEAVRGLPCRTIIATRDREYFRGLEIPENVEVTTASHEEFFRLMAGARVFALPLHGDALHPGGEQTYLNAMAMGKPVVVAADFGADEYISNGTNGVIVPTGDPSALRDALLTVLENPDFSRALGGAAKEAAKGYSLKNFVKSVLSLIDIDNGEP